MREYELEVLEQYDIEVKSTRKIRGAFFCETKEGPMLLREANISGRRAPLLYAVLTHLEADGHTKVDTPVFTKEGELLAASRDGTRYILKKWYIGRECDVKRESDLLEASRRLALLHRSMQWQEQCSVEEGQVIRPPIGRHLKEEFICHDREMKKVRSYIRSRVTKGEFEFFYLKHFEEMYALAVRVLQRLERSRYDELYQEAVESGCMVHGDYNYHNVLMTAHGTAVTNFEHFRIDVQVQDLYYFLRKVMEKNRWQERLGRNLLEAYSTVRPLDEREMEYIALKLSYPEKFWKMANAYYQSNKAWVPEKNVEKLKTSVIQTEEKLRFLEKIFSFIL